MRCHIKTRCFINQLQFQFKSCNNATNDELAETVEDENVISNQVKNEESGEENEWGSIEVMFSRDYRGAPRRTRRRRGRGGVRRLHRCPS